MANLISKWTFALPSIVDGKEAEVTSAIFTQPEPEKAEVLTRTIEMRRSLALSRAWGRMSYVSEINISLFLWFKKVFTQMFRIV